MAAKVAGRAPVVKMLYAQAPEPEEEGELTENERAMLEENAQLREENAQLRQENAQLRAMLEEQSAAHRIELYAATRRVGAASGPASNVCSCWSLQAEGAGDAWSAGEIIRVPFFGGAVDEGCPALPAPDWPELQPDMSVFTALEE
eukprot:SAG11_NODE_3538_length_2384_cov_2.310722_2_plen_146_part_00